MAEPYGWLAAILAAKEEQLTGGGNVEDFNAITQAANELDWGDSSRQLSAFQQVQPDWQPPATTAPTMMPTRVPAAPVASPRLTPVNPLAPGTTPVAQGAELMLAMLQATMQAEQLRQSAIDQTVSIARLMSDLARVSPTQAADLAVALGMPQHQPDLTWANRFVNPGTTGTFGGTVGTQQVQLPFSFNGRELTFLGQNRNAATMIADIASRFGRPDLLTTSAGALIPSSGVLAAAA